MLTRLMKASRKQDRIFDSSVRLAGHRRIILWLLFSVLRGSVCSSNAFVTSSISSNSSPEWAMFDTHSSEKYTIYCDLDGVLVDFEQGVRQLFPPDVVCSKNIQSSIQYLKKQNLFWQRIQESSSFFERLEWAPGGKQLWTLLRSTNHPIHILTGVPPYQESRFQKFRWCERELDVPVSHRDMAGPYRLHLPQEQQNRAASGVTSSTRPYHRLRQMFANNSIVKRGILSNSKRMQSGSVQYHHPDRTSSEEHDVQVLDGFKDDVYQKNTVSNIFHENSNQVCNVITCWSERKHYESRPGAVLIDDRIDLKEAWEQNGGIFIHHKTGDTASTIQQLFQRGVIKNNNSITIEDLQRQPQGQHHHRANIVQNCERNESLFIW